MKINYLVLEGFKSFKEKTRFDMSKKTLIVGRNFEGKTSIAEAIVYAFCGVSLNGESRAIEDLINNDCDEMSVSVNFDDDFDRNHTLTRVKNRKSQEAYLDEKEEPTTQKEINAFIGDHKLFLSCFNLGFFQNELEDVDRRSLIVQYAPAIDMEKLFSDFADRSLIGKYSIELFKQSEYARINKIKAQTADAIKETQIKISVLEEQNNAANSNASYNVIDEETEKQLKKQLEDLVACEKHNLQVQNLYNQYNERVVEYNKNAEKYRLVAQKLQELGDIGTTPTPFGETEECKALFREIDGLRTMTTPDIETSGQCPTCGSVISEEKIAENKAKNQELANRIDKINDYINAKNSEFNTVYYEYQSKMETKGRLEIELSMLAEIVQNVPQPPTDQLYDLSKGAEIKQQYDNIVAANNELRIKNAEMAAFIDSVGKRSAEIASLRTHLGLLTAQLEELTTVSAALSPTTGIFRKSIEIKAEFIRSEFNKCSIVLDKMQKNGEIKECFEIFYDNKPYRRLSYAEQMFCSLEIAKYLRTQSMKNFPIFIDNSESIINIAGELLESNQLIFALVKSQDLTVTEF